MRHRAARVGVLAALLVCVLALWGWVMLRPYYGRRRRQRAGSLTALRSTTHLLRLRKPPGAPLGL
eukprot:gene42187-5150_t